MKRTFLVIALVAALSLVFAGSAFANFGPHGGYISDTDSCAGCHRAHTSFSTLKYTPKVGGDLLSEDQKPSSLLVGNATTMTEFCNACHGATAPGASTNVVGGVFDGSATTEGGPSTAGLAATTTVQPYQTASTQGAGLNGGGFGSAYNVDSSSFVPVTSAHSMESVGILWGAGNGADKTMNLTCTSCHDPHGSSNYRLLKDSVNGVAVGGYTGNNPNGMVFSTEAGYANVQADGGWLKHEPGQAQMAAYKPDYTGGTKLLAGTPGASLSTWCAACHTRYNQSADTTNPANPTTYGAFENGGSVGSQFRHRHPVDIPLTAGDANLQVNAQDNGTFDSRIPLEARATDGVIDRTGNLGCLTCHFAHGSTYVMSGWAAAHLASSTTDPSKLVVTRDSTPGVDPVKFGVAGLPGGPAITGTSALLRVNNRGVCERCHNK